MLTEQEQAELLALARGAVEARVRGQAPPAVPSADFCRRSGGAFVTLTDRGALRGCIGYPEDDQPLGDVVVRCAAAAADRDPRFPPVTTAELVRLHVEVSVLGPLEPVREASEIEVGVHGLVVELEGRRGLLLPQVATDWRWNRETFLAQTCLKAGLPADAWLNGARILRFEAQVFGEPSSPAPDV